MLDGPTVLSDVEYSGHRSVYSNGVLHRDISCNNILIVPSDERDKRGMLIDLDYAKIRDGRDKKELHDDERTGTMVFMSLGACSLDSASTTNLCD